MLPAPQLLASSWNSSKYSGTKPVTPFCRTCPTSRTKSFPSSVESLSAMKPQSIKKFQIDFNGVKSRNKATIHTHVMPHLTRTVSRGENAEAIYKEFEGDVLDQNIAEDFSARSVPITPSHAFKQDLKRLSGVKNPKPDYTFGFRSSIFTEDEQVLLQRYDASYALSTGIISPFFIMGWKDSRGRMQDCSVQARRGGAAIVNARRQIHASRIPKYSYSSPDLATIAFSCAITSEIAYIAVHWCQRIADDDHWYMAAVRRFFLAEDDDIQKLRPSLHNIIDWGLSERLKSIKGELKVLDERWQLVKAWKLGTQEQGSVSKRSRKE